MSDDAPAMNEFFIRGVPLAEAVSARRDWRLLTDDEKEELGFYIPQETRN